MITISGTTQMTFMLPTDAHTAFAFYKDMNRIIHYLPRIELITKYTEQHFRVCYTSRELNAYNIKIYCDIQAEVNPENLSIRLFSQEADPPIKSKSGLSSTTAYGRYASESFFYPDAHHTRLEYTIHLSAELPKPRALKLVPDSMMSAIATSISNIRIQEIANGFISNSVVDIDAWQANQATQPPNP